MDRALIGGAWSHARKRRFMEVADPATGEAIASVPDCDDEDTRYAIEIADSIWPKWRRSSVGERAAVLAAWHQAVLGKSEDLARIITAEQGKPLREARAEVVYAASFISWYAAEALRVGGYQPSAPLGDRRIFVLKECVGVCAAITPWNFPAAMVTRKLAPALAAGCPMIIKPSELTPLTALALARLAQEAGVPDGVISVVTGAAEPIGRELTGNNLIKKVSFTGSTAVGRILMQQCANGIKRLSLELGGNAPFLVFDDADIPSAVEGLIASKFRNAGQICVSANRILIQGAIYDDFVQALADSVKRLRTGCGSDPETTIGPLISVGAAQKVRAHISDALEKGARIVAQGEDSPNRPAFVRPILLEAATPAMRLAQEETFGPVAALFKFETEEQAISLANATPYGLAAYCYAADSFRAWRVAEALEFGIVGMNTGSVSVETAPFGGIKYSGLGREGGREGIEEYLETKVLHWGGLG